MNAADTPPADASGHANGSALPARLADSALNGAPEPDLAKVSAAPLSGGDGGGVQERQDGGAANDTAAETGSSAQANGAGTGEADAEKPARRRRRWDSSGSGDGTAPAAAAPPPPHESDLSVAPSAADAGGEKKRRRWGPDPAVRAEAAQRGGPRTLQQNVSSHKGSLD